LKNRYGEIIKKADTEVEAEEDYREIDRAFGINCLMYRPEQPSLTINK